LHFSRLLPKSKSINSKEYEDECTRRGEGPHLQHPLIEIAEAVEKVPWSSDTDTRILERLEELDLILTLMFSAKLVDFTSVDALREQIAWRVVRRLAAALLESIPLGKVCGFQCSS
jgi:hypothetical protein